VNDEVSVAVSTDHREVGSNDRGKRGRLDNYKFETCVRNGDWILRGFVSPKGRNLTTRGTGDHRDVRTERVVPVGVVQIVRRRIQALMLPEDTYNIILITGKHPHQTPNTNHQSPRDSSLTAERIFLMKKEKILTRKSTKK